MIKISHLQAYDSIEGSHGIWPNEVCDVQISTDSRNLKGANCFIALYGESFNGNDFIENVINQGVKIVIYCEKKGVLKQNIFSNHSVIFLKVDDTYKYLLSLAEIVSSSWQEVANKKMIGITGSNGKTTNKEMLYHLLDNAMPGKVHKTQGNLNNHIGVPLTIFSLKKEHEVAIIEMGMNHPGEIFPLAKAARATCGLITSIGQAHLEFMKTIENIFKEKKALYDWIEGNGGENKVFVVNNSDKYLAKIPSSNWCYHLTDHNFKVEGGGFSLRFDERVHQIENDSLIGRHNIINMAQCLLLAVKIFPQHEQKIVEAANSFKMPKMNRGDFIVNSEGMVIFLDAYNANPTSMMASIESFKVYCKKNNFSLSEALFILGDMNELGPDAAKLHQEVGASLALFAKNPPVFIGRYAEHYKKGYGKTCNIFNSVHDVKNIKVSPCAIFIKGSRSLQLESLIDINDRLNFS